METYKDLKNRHKNELESFEGLICAKNVQELKDKLKSIGCDENTQLVKVMPGIYVIKDRFESFKALLKKQREENFLTTR